MRISALTSIVRNYKPRINTVIRQTPVMSPEQSITHFFKTIPAQSNFYTYSDIAKNEIINFVKQGDEGATSFIKVLVNNNAAEKDILALLKEPEKFDLYRTIKVGLNKLLRNVKFNSLEEESVFSSNLSLLGVKDKKSFLNLTDTKGFQEIIDGHLSSEYIKGLTSNDKIGYNHFYDLFATIEKETDARLAKIAGLDKKAVTELIKAMDETICKSPQELTDLLEILEKHKNPQAVNKILKLFEPYIKEGLGTESVKELIRNTNDIEPEIFNEVFKFYKEGSHFPYGFTEDLLSFTSKNNKIDKDLLNFLIQHKEKYNRYSIREINNFLNIKGTDKNILKQYMNALNKMDQKEYIGLYLNSVSENNVMLFKKMLTENKINKENYTKLLLTKYHEIFKNPENWSKVNDVYQETFVPMFNATNKDFWKTLEISQMRIDNPESYNRLKEMGIIDLVTSHKLNADVIQHLGTKRNILPEVYRDVDMLKKGESLIKHFTSFDNILSKTSAGDVVSVNGKMFINNKGRLEAWNMTEEKFNELFPLAERFIGHQGSNDCFFFSAIESMYCNPKTRGNYYKLFEQQGDDILVTIPAYKDFQGTVKFNNGEIVTTYRAGRGAKHTLMLEQAYGRTALRLEQNTPATENPILTENMDYLYERLHGGQTSDVLKDLLNINPNLGRLTNNKHLAKKVLTRCFKTPDPECVEKLFNRYGNNPKLMFNLGIKVEDGAHAISVHSYDPKTGIMTIVDPNNLGTYEEIPLSELAPKIIRIWTTIV